MDKAILFAQCPSDNEGAERGMLSYSTGESETFNC